MSDTPYSNMTIWALEQERAKIEAELKTRYLVRGDAPAPEAMASNADVLAQVEAALRKNPLISTFLDQSFWHANFVDIAIRYNGELRHFEADWIKDIWYIVRRRGLSATRTVRAEQGQSDPPMNSGSKS